MDNTTKHILYISQHFSGPTGTSGLRHYINVKALIDHGFKTTILCGRYDRAGQVDLNALESEGARIIVSPIVYSQQFNVVNKLMSFIRFMLWSMTKAIAINSVDVIYASSTPLTIGLIGAIVSKIKRCKFVFEVRDVWPEAAIGMGVIRNPILIILLRHVAKYIYFASSHMIVLSDDMKTAVMTYGVSAEHIDVIHNYSFPDCATYNMGRTDIVEGGNWKDRFRLIHLGTMGRVNGVEYLVDVAVELAQLGFEERIQIILMGEGSETNSIISCINRRGLTNILVMPPVMRMNVWQVLSTMHIGVVTVRPIKELYANSANKLFDYMSAGLPVMINYGGWQSKIIDEYQIGFGHEGITPNQFAQSVISLYNDPCKWERMSRASYALARGKYNHGTQTARLCDILSSLLS